MLPYRLPADVESKLCDAFGVIVDEDVYGKNGIQRSTFLFDPNGTLVHVWPRARTGSCVSSSIDELLENSAAYAAEFAGPSTHVPSKAVAIVTCMDTRINGFRIFGLEPGDAHVLRNAGGLVTDDVLRSLVISQRLLGTREVMLVHHTKCGLHGADDATLRAEIAGDVGRAPPYELGAFDDLDDAVRAAIARVRSHPFLPHRDRVRGFVYDVDSGRLREVVV